MAFAYGTEVVMKVLTVQKQTTRDSDGNGALGAGMREIAADAECG